MALDVSKKPPEGDRGGGVRPKACECGQCADCTERAAAKKGKAKNRQFKRRAASHCGGGRSKGVLCADCIGRAAVKNDKVKNRQVKRRVANQAAGDDGEQEKKTEARQRKRAANQEAGGKAEQGKNVTMLTERTTPRVQFTFSTLKVN